MCNDGFSVISSASKIFKGYDITLTCDCDGVPQPTYAWFQDGNAVGVTKQLSIVSADQQNNGVYQCVASNVVKNVSSSPYTVAVIGESNFIVVNTGRNNRFAPIANTIEKVALAANAISQTYMNNWHSP